MSGCQLAIRLRTLSKIPTSRSRFYCTRFCARVEANVFLTRDKHVSLVNIADLMLTLVVLFSVLLGFFAIAYVLFLSGMYLFLIIFWISSNVLIFLINS